MHKVLLVMLLSTITLAACVSNKSFFLGYDQVNRKLYCDLNQTFENSFIPTEVSLASYYPITTFQIFREVHDRQAIFAAINPLSGREFLLTIDNNQLTSIEVGRFISSAQAIEISLLSTLIQPWLENPNLDCNFHCNEIKLHATCHKSLTGAEVVFEDKRLNTKYTMRAMLKAKN